MALPPHRRHRDVDWASCQDALQNQFPVLTAAATDAHRQLQIQIPPLGVRAVAKDGLLHRFRLPVGCPRAVVKCFRLGMAGCHPMAVETVRMVRGHRHHH
jgi:hypothetical protein